VSNLMMLTPHQVPHRAMTTNIFAARVTLVLFIASAVAGCAHRAAPPTPLPPIVTVSKPVTYPVQTYFEYNGNLDATEMVQVVAPVQGFLKDYSFREGDDVKEGDLLFEIDPHEFVAAKKRAEADRAKAIAEEKRAKADVERVEKIRATGAISQEEFAQRAAA